MERRVFEQHLLLSEYGMAGVWLYEEAPAPEYQAHAALLRGQAEKAAEDADETESEANRAANHANTHQ